MPFKFLNDCILVECTKQCTLSSLPLFKFFIQCSWSHEVIVDNASGQACPSSVKQYETIFGQRRRKYSHIRIFSSSLSKDCLMVWLLGMLARKRYQQLLRESAALDEELEKREGAHDTLFRTFDKIIRCFSTYRGPDKQFWLDYILHKLNCKGLGFMTNKKCDKNQGTAEVFMISFYLS